MRALSSAAKYALHAARSGWISSLDDAGGQVTDATMNALARRGLVTIDLQRFGHWSVARLTDAGRQAYASIECQTCRGSKYVPSPEGDGTGVTCTACRGLGYTR